MRSNNEIIDTSMYYILVTVLVLSSLVKVKIWIRNDLEKRDKVFYLEDGDQVFGFEYYDEVFKKGHLKISERTEYN